MASQDLNIGASPPVNHVPTSRALTRVTPVAPQPATTSNGSPLDRSGLSVVELFTTADEVVARTPTPALALDMGLEQARGAMVRNSPAEALAVLDEVWSGARHTETGWYLRASALALLGLTAEASRIASEAVGRNPDSSANHFLLSLAKLTQGELQEARAAVAVALKRRGPDALLLVQSALLEARDGNAAEAERLMKYVTREWPDHPAIQYGQRMVQELVRTRTRDALFSTAGRGINTFESSVSVATPSASLASAVAEGDSIAESLIRLGNTIREGASTQEVANMVRSMLSSLATGGALANATAPARAHAMRSVLSAVLSTMGTSAKSASVGWAEEDFDGQWQRVVRNTPDSNLSAAVQSHEELHETVRALVSSLAAGRSQEIEQQLSRAHSTVDGMTVTLLRCLAGMTTGEPSRRQVASGEYPSQTPVSDTEVGRRAPSPEPPLLTPIRLGLALLPEADLLNHVLRPVSEDVRAIEFGGYASAATLSGVQEIGNRAANGSFGTLVGAALLFALALLSLAFRQTLIGIALAGAGGWLLLRKGSTDSRAPVS